MSDAVGTTWEYASLTLHQPRWPGRSGAEWEAIRPGGASSRSKDVLALMNELGAAGWELAAFSPEHADRPDVFYFKMRRAVSPQGPPGG